MNICAALTACSFFENKPGSIAGAYGKDSSVDVVLRAGYPEFVYYRKNRHYKV